MMLLLTLALLGSTYDVAKAGKVIGQASLVEGKLVVASIADAKVKAEVQKAFDAVNALPKKAPVGYEADMLAELSKKHGLTLTKVPESIGSVTMQKDGTLTLMLRAEDGRGAVGDALLTYGPKDPKYAEILKHVGPIKPGESKPVMPFPEAEPKKP